MTAQRAQSGARGFPLPLLHACERIALPELLAKKNAPRRPELMKTESDETAKAAVAVEPATTLRLAARASTRAGDWTTQLMMLALFALVCYRAATQSIAHDSKRWPSRCF